MLPSFSSAPSGRVERDIWYRSDTKKVWYQDDTWPHELWSGSTGGADIGTMAYGLSAPNADYLPCDWAPLSQSTYSDLYAQVGINPSFTAWVGKTIPGMQWFIDIAYSSSLGKYVGITSSVLSISSDGVNWNVMTPKIWGSLASVTWCSGLGMFVVGSGNFCYTSTDGISWIPSYINANVNVTLLRHFSSVDTLIQILIESIIFIRPSVQCLAPWIPESPDRCSKYILTHTFGKVGTFSTIKTIMVIKSIVLFLHHLFEFRVKHKFMFLIKLL